MMPINEIGTLCSNNADSKRHKLIDMIINHQRDEQKQLIKRVEDLKKDPSKKLAVSRPYNEHNTLIFTSDSSCDMQIWRLCLIHAHLKLNIRISFLKYQNAALRYSADEFTLLMEYLKPIIHRSQFTEESNEVGSDFQGFETMLDSVLEKYNNDTQVLLANWEEIKNSREMAITARYIQFYKSKAENIAALFYLDCESGRDCSLWNSALSAALSILDTSESFFQTLFIGNPNNTFGKQIYGNMNVVDLGSVLKLLKPLSEIAHFKSLTGDTHPEVVECFTEFFEAGSINALTFPDNKPENICFKPLLKLVRKVRPSYAIYKRLPTEAENEDLLVLADSAEHISIYECRGSLKPLSLSLIRSILSRKCICLDIYGSTTLLSLADVEDLIQFAHHVSKKFTFAIRKLPDMVDIQVGEYIILENRQNMIIEHMDIGERFSTLYRDF